MEYSLSMINTLLVDIFNNCLVIEQNALRDGKFYDVSITEVHTVEAIGMYEAKTMSEAARTLDITVGTLSVAINNLVKKGYVKRVRSQTDRRVVYIRLTKKGRLLYRVHEQFHKNMVLATIEGLQKEEEEALKGALVKLNLFLNQKYIGSKGEKA